jgi:hypothetical protein
MGFYLKQTLFSIREELTGFVHTAASLALYPLVACVIAVVWNRYTQSTASFSFAELLRYIGVTELLYLTGLRAVNGGWAQADFSLSLARPRSWLLTHFLIFFGCSSGKRVIHTALFIMVFATIGGGSVGSVLLSAARLMLLLPVLGVLESLYSLLLCTLELVAPQSSYFRFLIGKLFLVCGGVIAPLSEVKGSVGEILRATPWSDMIFQVGYFCVRGHFYGLQAGEWVLRILLHLVALAALVFALNLLARRNHQAFGG